MWVELTLTSITTVSIILASIQRTRNDRLKVECEDLRHNEGVMKRYNKIDREEKSELRRELADEKLKSSELQRISKHQAKELTNYKTTMQEIADHKGIIYRTKPYGFAVMASDTIFMTPQELAQRALERGGKVT